MIALVSYGLGNIQAYFNIYKRLNVPVVVADTEEKLRLGDKIILPGVGAFDWAMQRLNESGLRDCLEEMVKVRNCPVLGVCVGMQMMAKCSEEGKLPGLDWIDAEVRRFDVKSAERRMRLPHMGWNDAHTRVENRLIPSDPVPRFYFLHSYYFAPRDPNVVLATTDYFGNFASAVNQANVYGTQFHPEKSHLWGIQVLKNFAEL